MSIKRFVDTIAVTSLAVALSVAMLCIGLTPKAFADESNKKTVMTFSAPVEIPGKALPAGTYVFKLLTPHRTAISFRYSIRTRRKS